MIVESLLVVGAGFILLAAIGILRYDDVFVRMQILSKASTFGLLCVLAGSVATLTSANDLTFIVLAALLNLVTLPVSGNLLARSTYFAPGIDHHVDSIDELAELTASESPDP